MKRRLLLIPLYLLFFLISLVFFFWLTIPWSRVEQLVARKVEAATGYQMTAEEFGSYWLTGIEATNVVLQKPLTPEQRKAVAAARKARAAQKEAKPGEKGGSGTRAGTALEEPSREAGKTDEQADPEGAHQAGEGEGEGKTSQDQQDQPQLALPKPIHLPLVQARLAVLPLIIGRVVVNFTVEAAGGTIEGSIGKSGDTWLGELQASEVRLAAIPWLADLLKVSMKGVLEVEGELTLALKEMTQTRGRVTIRLKSMELGAGEIPLPKGSMFPSYELSSPTKLGTLELVLVVGEEVAREPNAALLHLESFKHQGEDLELKAEGDVVLLSELGQSRPDLTLGVKFAEPFVQRNHLSMLLNGKDVKRYLREEFLGIALKGTLAKLDPKLTAPVWGKSRPYLRATAGTAGGASSGPAASPTPPTPGAHSARPPKGSGRVTPGGRPNLRNKSAAEPEMAPPDNEDTP